MKTALMIYIFSLSSFIYAQDVSFKRGLQIPTIEISGHVSVRCDDGNRGSRNYYYNCYDSSLTNGGSYGQIVVNETPIDADWVKLQKDGTKYIKGSHFNGSTQESKKNFNLWIRTLLQRPLLSMGENLINYTFLKENKEVFSGQMSVQVIEGESRVCRNGSLWYRGSCPSVYSACADYFQKYNYCK